MNDIYITLHGNVAAEPRQHVFDDGSRVTSLRLAVTPRQFDRRNQTWTDGETVYFAIRCWRTLADNVAQSVKVGHPLMVSGKLRIREFGPEGERRFMPEIEASSIGHDLRYGLGAFSKPERVGTGSSLSREAREQLDHDTQDWAMAAGRYSRPGLPDPDAAIRVLGELSEETTVHVLTAAEAEESADADADASSWTTESRAA
ncbi:single-stranded DNA-binding protein [Nonomuraea soli]|uniref:Single-strand DNA-binding protein n=1 Tax=Nonomuraea soli TaxID=1032476 RepID=A0A7W0CLN6_9ACTN|nr:single-stranded DNA-binding protein [Nonomuraea soli]MBA2893487.1 single-strand DNA-binding protein [Nonomuraea soli]